jgi:hypothetical protein
MRLPIGGAPTESSGEANVTTAAIPQAGGDATVYAAGASSTEPTPTPLEPNQASVQTASGATRLPLLLSAPLQVQAGREFAVAVSLPPGATASLRVQLNYDSGKLEALDGEIAAPGVVALRVTRTATLRFRAASGNSGVAVISVGDISPADEGGDVSNVMVPAPAQINITP